MRAAVMCGIMVATAGTARGQGGLAIGPKLGTLGPGLDLTAYLTDEINLRINGNYLNFGFDGSVDDVDYDAEIQFSSLVALLDWHPFLNNFRITGGAAFTDNEIELDGNIDDETVEIGGTDYTSAQIGTLTGRAIFDDLAGYFGLGYGNAVMDDVDLSFSFDLGVLFQSAPDVDLSADGTAAGTPGFEQDLKQEEDDVEEEIDGFTIYPVLAFGIQYYFW